jgi:(E)-4-hydroxy-3-methylbut-2-enyl-diphosphate synthase
MCATKTRDIDATVAQVHQLAAAGAGVVRIAVDNEKEVAALKEIRAQTDGVTLSVDLQENYRVAASVAPWVDKIRYNPGHLHHIERAKSIADKVGWLADVARDNDCAVRIGVNCGSVAPEFLERHPGEQLEAIVQSALYHCDLMERLGFDRFVVSLKDSDPRKWSRPTRASPRPARHPDPSRRHRSRHAAGGHHQEPPRLREAAGARHRRHDPRLAHAAERAQARGSQVGHKIIEDVAEGRFISVPDFGKGLNIISCPSCSRVENESFVELAQHVRELTATPPRIASRSR